MIEGEGDDPHLPPRHRLDERQAFRYLGASVFWGDVMDYLPFGIASTVKDKSGQIYLIHEISDNLEYSLIGHDKFGTGGQASAWHEHGEFELVSHPTIKSWTLWMEAFNGLDDDDEDVM